MTISLYNPITDPFYPYRDETTGEVKQAPLREILLGNLIVGPVHPDPAIQAFLRYVPSLFLQVLNIEMEKNEWVDLVQKGKDSNRYTSFRQRVEERLKEKTSCFNMPDNSNGFYQHYAVKRTVEAEEAAKKAAKGKKGNKDKTEKNRAESCKLVNGRDDEGLDKILLHATAGNNPCHHKHTRTIQKLCPACALIAFMHHTYFCVSGLGGNANFRGEQAYLCNIHKIGAQEMNSLQRMILNTYFPKVAPEHLQESMGWQKAQDVPSWEQLGRSTKKGFEDLAKDVGLIRTMLYTPKHCFLNIVQNTNKHTCDLCGIASPPEKLVESYYWRGYGNFLADHKIEKGGKKPKYRVVGHPTLPLQSKKTTNSKSGVVKKSKVEMKYNASVWRDLACLSLAEFQKKKTNTTEESFEAAPLVQQLQYAFQRKGTIFYSLELQAYHSRQEKLFGYHHHLMQLPLFGEEPEEKKQQVQFYALLESFTATLTTMLDKFKSWGSVDKKRKKEQIPGIDDAHWNLVQVWGQTVMGDVSGFVETQRQGKLPEEMLAKLKECKRQLVEEFEQLCDAFAWDDLSAQRKLFRQKQEFEKNLVNLWKGFEKKYIPKQEKPKKPSRSKGESND